MKKTFLLLSFAGFLALLFSSYSSGPALNGQGNRTGATGGTTACAGGCHGSTSSIGTIVELDSAGIAVSSYHPGMAYTVKITATNSAGTGVTNLSHFGFQLSTVKTAAAGTSGAVQAGTWGTLAGTHVTTTGSCSVVEHSAPLSATSGSGGIGTVYSVSVPWTAPAAGTGSLKIYGVVNAVNFNGTDNTGDKSQIASTVPTITEAVAVTASVSIAITSGTNPICSGNTGTLTATPVNGGTAPTYQWYVNSTPIPGATGASYTVTAPGAGNYIVDCVMTSNLPGVSGSPATSNSITIVVIANVTPSLSISTPTTSICSGASATFTAVPTGGGTSPSYQWQVNGSNAGTNSPTYATTSLTNGQSVTCILTSNAQCASPATATSNSISMTVNPSVAPSVSISQTAGTNPTCAGSSVTYTATPANGGSSPSYQWLIGATNAGTNSPTFTTTSLTNGQTVSCVMTSNASCAVPATTTSNVITMSINPVVTPTVTISTPSTSVCPAASVTFTATPVNGGSPSYQWKVNGTNVGTNSPTYTTTTLTNNAVVTCVITSTAACLTSPTATSNALTMSVAAQTPAITITATASSTGSGSPDTFTAQIINGGTSPSFQWKVDGTNAGTNSSTFITSSLTTGATVTCMLTSSLACASPTSVTSAGRTITVNATVTPTISISVVRDTICPGVSENFTATGTNLGTSATYQWSVNGTNTGTNSNHFISSALTNGNVVHCVVTSSATCASPSQATSNNITMTVLTAPAVTISPSGTLTVCAGDSLLLTANGALTYQWTTSDTSHAIWVKQSGTFNVTGSNGICSASAANAAVVTLNTPVVPVISQSLNTLTSTPAAGYQWIFNSAALTADTLPSLDITQSGNYAIITRDSAGCFARSINYLFSYTDTTTHPNGITETNGKPDVKIYPVPNSGTFVIETADAVNASLTIYDIYGQKVFGQALTSDHTQISGLHLSPAIYFVSVSVTGRVETIKMQVTKE